MQLGAKIGSNTSYLPAEAVASMPASYQLLRRGTFTFSRSTAAGRRLTSATVAPWERHRLGLMKNTDLPADIRERRRVFLAAQLARARAFAERLDFAGEAPPVGLKILQLVGVGTSVVDSAYYDGSNRRRLSSTRKT